MVSEFARVAADAGYHMLAEYDAMTDGFYREGTQIEELVMERTKGQPIGLFVGSAHVMPLDVSCLQASRHMTHPQVESADTASPLVGAQDAIAKTRVALATTDGQVRVGGFGFLGAMGRFQIKTDSSSDVLVQSRGKVGIEHAQGRLAEQARLVHKCP